MGTTRQAPPMQTHHPLPRLTVEEQKMNLKLNGYCNTVFFQSKGEGYLTFVASFTLANEEIKNNIDNSEIQFVQKRSLIYFRNETEDK